MSTTGHSVIEREAQSHFVIMRTRNIHAPFQAKMAQNPHKYCA
jgi:hypothetical protein